MWSLCSDTKSNLFQLVLLLAKTKTVAQEENFGTFSNKACGVLYLMDGENVWISFQFSVLIAHLKKYRPISPLFCRWGSCGRVSSEGLRTWSRRRDKVSRGRRGCRNNCYPPSTVPRHLLYCVPVVFHPPTNVWPSVYTHLSKMLMTIHTAGNRDRYRNQDRDYWTEYIIQKCSHWSETGRPTGTRHIVSYCAIHVPCTCQVTGNQL